MSEETYCDKGYIISFKVKRGYYGGCDNFLELKAAYFDKIDLYVYKIDHTNIPDWINKLTGWCVEYSRVEIVYKRNCASKVIEDISYDW